MADTLSDSTEPTSADDYGNEPKVNESTLKSENRVVSSVPQAIQLCESDVQDAQKLIKNAARITKKKNGASPFNPQTLKNQGKAWKRNISTRFFQKELARVAPRLYMPILTASTMTAAALPAGWPDGLKKTEFFRETMTKFFRSWKKNDWFWRGLKTEVSDYGYAFACWTEPYEWRPNLVRMDRGFVPRGTEIMDESISRFSLKLDYQPNELLSVARKGIEEGDERWNKDAVAAAVQAANLPALPADYSQLRKWEELIREQSWDYNYTRATRVIESRHLWVLEYSGKVSHYILWPDGPSEYQLLFEHLDAYESMNDVVVPEVFAYGDGTIHGSWGAGQLLYDLAAQVEKIRNDSIDNLLNSNKARLQVPNAKDAATAQLVVNDTMIIATGAQFAQNVGGISGNPEGYMVLDDRMTRWAQEVVGSYLPPIPQQSSDIKAAQINAALAAEQEVQRDVLEASLKQDAHIIATMTKRALNPETNDPQAIALRKKLLGQQEENEPPQPVALTEQELDLLINQPVVQAVTEFTVYAQQQRGAFAASVMQNPLFNQTVAANLMATGAGGQTLADSIVIPENDTTQVTAAVRQQLIENATILSTGLSLPVVITDAHKIHMDTMVEPMNQVIMGGLIPVAKAGLEHFTSHFISGTSMKLLGDDGNKYKSLIATFQKAIEAKEQEQAAAQAQQQPAQQMQQSPVL